MLQPAQARTNKLLLLQILLLDLMGFSLIFPLVPNLLDYYLKHAVENPMDAYLPRLAAMLAGLLPTTAEHAEANTIVLFGGVLASIYSFLQFLSSAWWGRLSDKMGRRPVLLLTSGGLVLSYVLWIFSSSFTVFLLSRVLGGLMAGNMGVASASMADMSSKDERTKAMGMLGAIFGVGFILGPAVGGIVSKWDPTTTFPGIPFIHPFSACAFAAALLSGFSALRNFMSFKETIPERASQAAPSTGEAIPEKRWVENPFGILRRELGFEGFFYLVLITFLFTTLFAGFEFSITFFYKLDFGLSPASIAFVFVYIGVLIAVGQGVLVRRMAPRFPEKVLALVGLAMIPIPLYLLARTAPSVGLSLLVLLPMTLGSSLIRPALSGLGSL
ncbi:MAG: MFS transporter, partial [Spirochaetia bacterium]|nr:MFS transporter [Spirochaetia bacterium]